MKKASKKTKPNIPARLSKLKWPNKKKQFIKIK